MTYSERERARAAAWEQSTDTLPEAAKLPSQYVGKDGIPLGPSHGFCLAPEHAAFSLLPEVRETVIDLFAELGIPWHAGVSGGPSNHLLSSQVQCANALGQMVNDPERIRRAFGELLDIDEVLQVEPNRFLTFEYIGPTDYFGEAPHGQRVRGAHCTSLDAAFLHRARDGLIELVLVEWKYTESYRRRQPDPAKDAVRWGRYGAAWSDPHGPVRSELVEFTDVLQEPFYQLVRQQLLAHALERDGAQGTERVRVVHVLPRGNESYQTSMFSPALLALGDTVSRSWQRLLRTPDRFLPVDSAVFLDPQVTSREYVLRYAEDVVHDEQELKDLLGVDDALDLADVIFTDEEFDGLALLHEEGIELILGYNGTGLAYPFSVSEIWEVVDDLLRDARSSR